jgi:hypothetical protein
MKLLQHDVRCHTVAFSPPDAAHATADSDDATADPVTQNAAECEDYRATGNGRQRCKLISAVTNTRKKKNWQELGCNCRALVPGRTKVQCKNRWHMSWLSASTGRHVRVNGKEKTSS